MTNKYIREMVNAFRYHPQVKAVAVTGGPCSGKSTFLNMARGLLRQHSLEVKFIPEVARELIATGFSPLDNRWKSQVAFQRQVFLAILEKETRCFQALQELNLGDMPVVFLCDRGLPDGAAYCDRQLFEEMLNSFELTYADVRDRYTAAIHLVTAADGAEEHYVSDAERWETPEAARAADKRTLAAWLGHQHHTIVNNSQPFTQKVEQALRALERVVPMSKPKEIERKFLVTGFSSRLIQLDWVPVDIEQIYLSRPDKPGIECRVRCMYSSLGSSYYYTEKSDTQIAGVRVENEEQINKVRYSELIKAYRDPACTPVVKRRYKFPYGSHVLELDVFQNQLTGLVLLEAEFKSVEEMKGFILPPFFSLTDVTGNKAYSNRRLAEKGIPE